MIVGMELIIVSPRKCMIGLNPKFGQIRTCFIIGSLVTLRGHTKVIKELEIMYTKSRPNSNHKYSSIKYLEHKHFA